MQWSLKQVAQDALVAWVGLLISIPLAAFLYAVLAVNGFSQGVQIGIPFAVMVVVLLGVHLSAKKAWWELERALKREVERELRRMLERGQERELVRARVLVLLWALVLVLRWVLVLMLVLGWALALMLVLGREPVLVVIA